MVKGSPDFNHHSPGLSLSPPTTEGHWSPHHRGQSDVSQPDLEGPQASPAFDGHRSVNRDSEGLQTVVASSPYNSGTWQPGNIPYQGKEPEKFPAQADFQPAVIDASKKSRRKWWYVGIAILVAVVIILAAVLGGVLGSRAHRDATTQSSAQADNSGPTMTASSWQSHPSTAAAAPTGRARSAEGTWNGTGISTYLEQSLSSGHLFFQDASGAINHLTYTINPGTSQLSVGPATLPDCPAANGTGIAGQLVGYPDNSMSFHLIYVNRDGVLAECYQNASSNGGAWVTGPGNLSSHGFKAPTDNRPALYMNYGYLDGKASGTTGYRLYAGGMDGEVHQYSFDENTSTWNGSITRDFPGSWAYGAALAVNRPGPGDTYNRSVFLTDPSGAIQAYVQNDGFDNTNTNWPYGGAWSRALDSPYNTAINSSLGRAIGTDGKTNLLFFVDQTGHLAAEVTNSSLYQSSSTSFEHQLQPLPGQSAMEGTDFDFEGPFGNSSLIFYQDEGTSIAWMILDGSLQEVLSSGHIRLQDNAWNVTA